MCLADAFPAEVAGSVAAVLSALEACSDLRRLYSPNSSFPELASGYVGSHKVVAGPCVQGQRLVLPYRIYKGWPSPESVSLEGSDLDVAACLMTRYADGFIRQAWLPVLLRSTAPWTVPYVVALLGEYVVQIIQEIAETWRGWADDDERARLVAEFTANNAPYAALMRMRSVTYWDIYYRREVTRWRDYPAAEAFTHMNHWACTQSGQA